MADSSNGFRIELLGPVEAWADGRAVALGGQRPRALFAVALMAGRRRWSARDSSARTRSRIEADRNNNALYNPLR